jgi:hypothetical protein
VLPIDDSSFRIYSAGRVTESGALAKIRSRFAGRPWDELTPQEHQQMPGDYEVQVSQGAITLHSEEHLVTSDRGVALLRRLLEQQLEVVKAGRDPIGLSFVPADDLVHLEAGTSIVATNEIEGESRDRDRCLQDKQE